MAAPFIQPSFVGGEIAPSLFGRVDLDKEHIATTTERNFFVSYRGGAQTRAGTKFVGFSKQTGRDFPPRLIPFQFSINQGLALEFGNFYMRVIDDGAFVTEAPVAIGGATRADPAVLTFGAEGATAATPNNGAVTFSYAPGDLVTLLGGTALTEAVLQVTTSQLVSVLVNAAGAAYAMGDTITLGGGTSAPAAVVTVLTVVPIPAKGNILFGVNPSDGDTITLNGVTWTFKTVVSAPAETAIFPTLAQTLTQLVSDLNASTDASLIVATYSATLTQLNIVYDTPGTGGNAYTLAASVATPSAGTLAGGATDGLGTVSVTTPGIFTAIPGTGAMTQASTSGGGTGASFQTAVFGPHAVTISNPGAYTALPANPAHQDATTGIGMGATFTVTWAAVPAFSNGDWIFIEGVNGMTQLNGNTYVVAGAGPTSVSLLDVYGNPIDSTAFGAYTGGGTAARIFTLVTPYAEADLKWLKFTQSADVMSICCVNQSTGTEYQPQDLSRLSDTDWTFTPVVSNSSIAAPASLSVTITNVGAYFYQYDVTAVSPDDGSESVASPIQVAEGSQLINGSQNILQWSPVPGVNEYNIYKAPPSSNVPVPTGSLFGYIGSAYGTSFHDTGILPNFDQVPPLHKDPFARGQVIGVNIVTGGTGYTHAAATVTSGTGAGATFEVLIIFSFGFDPGPVQAIIITDAGHDYQPGDTISITGDGTGATASLIIGPETGTYPSVPGYFQERRVYANTLNNPDTYFMSQPGSFTNFDSRIPTIDTDAITGSPWAVQVNGIQFLVQVASGLLVMTGASAWILQGPGSFATNVQPISPSSQVANPQPFTGCSATIPPIKEDYDVIYVSAAGSLYFDLPYQLYALSQPIDLTQYSTHLFTGFDIVEHAWCKQPNKLLWAVRDDGTMLSMTFLKLEEISGWARHDTNGLFKSVCSVTEPPVDALYMATQRFPGNKTAYMIERMDNRLWEQVEDAWCVDCGLTLPQPTPNATLTADSATGIGSITGVTGLVGGTGYSAATTAQVVDNNGQGPGAGAVPTLTIVGGVITAVTFAGGNQGGGYINPQLVITDPAGSGGGSGASARPILNNAATFTADGAVFSAGNVGSVIRMGGGIAVITAFTDAEHVTAQINTPITGIRPNSGGVVQPQTTGNWTLTKPISTISGLDYLAGATVTGLADGNPISPRIVAADGSITLDAPASSVVVGLGFQAQLQGVYFEAGQSTVQGQRKKIAAGNVLFQASRGMTIGGSQPDGSTQSPPQIAPPWANLSPVDTQPNVPLPPYNSNVVPLYTGYMRIPVESGFTITGQVSIEQDMPLPCNVNSIVSEALPGDNVDVSIRQRQGGRGQ